MRFILVLVMLFNLITTVGLAEELIDRVIAYVDNYVITMRDFMEFSKKMEKSFPNIKKEEIIETMINRTLLLSKAKEHFTEGNEEELINSYIELKIKSTIIISETQVRDYYEKNKDKFKDTPYYLLRDQIERYLFEVELNSKLKEHIKELKKSSEVRLIFIP